MIIYRRKTFYFYGSYLLTHSDDAPELFDFISIILNGIYAPCMVFSCIGG